MSDILIKNMELPKKGHFLFQISANGDVWVSNRNDEGTGIIIAKAIELPPHGRLGDLDRVRERLGDDIFICYDCRRLLDDVFDTAPTIVEASI